jgi:hypothetical protein
LGTCVLIDLVPIIAGFARGLLDMTVTTTGECAVLCACIGLDVIAIITGFDALLHHAIATTSELTGVQTGVLIDGVAIIAGFIVCLALQQIQTLDSITTPSGHAIR